jgi:hypothetical protein
MRDRQASSQSGTGRKKNNDGVTGPVRPKIDAVRHVFGPVVDSGYEYQSADACINFLNAMPAFAEKKRQQKIRKNK